jgi:hypothetical protein
VAQRGAVAREEGSVGTAGVRKEEGGGAGLAGVARVNGPDFRKKRIEEKKKINLELIFN